MNIARRVDQFETNSQRSRQHRRSGNGTRNNNAQTAGLLSNNPASDDPARHQPNPGDIRRQLERITASAMFRDAFRLRSFLHFVVETALSGDTNMIKAYTIAVEALGRGSNFDPQNDPIVRVEAGRLRRALARYYDELGGDDRIVIEIPSGAYVPVFRTRQPDIGPDRLSGEPALPDDPPAAAALPLSSRMLEMQAELKLMRYLAAVQRLQIAAIATTIERSKQMLRESQQLLQAATDCELACRHALPLLPTAPSSTTEASKAADERARHPEHQADQAGQAEQAQGPAAARPRRPRPDGDRRDPPDDRDHPRRLRALRL